MMGELEEVIGIGRTVPLGTYRFEADDIKRFARLYDPQPFHLDEEAARSSVLGGLCASGWHVCSVWMKLNVAQMAADLAAALAEGRPYADYGPSPGLRNVTWKKPAYAGDTLSYFTRPLAVRERHKGDGYHLMTLEAWAEKGGGEQVTHFNSAALVRLARP